MPVKIVKSLEELGLLIKGVSEKIKNDAKVQRGRFLSMVLGTLGGSLLGNMLAGKGVITGGDGFIPADEAVIRGGDGVSSSRSRRDQNRSKFLIAPHPVTNFEIQKYYQNKPKFNDVYSRDNLHKIMDEENIINLDEYEPIGTHWIAVYVNGDNVTYFDNFGVKNIPK